MKLLKKIALIIITVFFTGAAAFAQKQIVVCKDGKGDFKTIQDAINSLPAGAKEQRIIFIKKGTYNEKIFIDKARTK